MSIKEQLLNDYKTSIKEKDVNTKNVVTMLRSAILQVEKDNHIELEDAAIIEIVAKQVKQRKDSIVEFEKGNRADLVEQANAELKYLYRFMPAQLSKEEVCEVVKEAIAKLNITEVKQMGALMAEVMPSLKGKADGKLINEVARELLAK